MQDEERMTGIPLNEWDICFPCGGRRWWILKSHVLHCPTHFLNYPTTLSTLSLKQLPFFQTPPRQLRLSPASLLLAHRSVGRHLLSCVMLLPMSFGFQFWFLLLRLLPLSLSLNSDGLALLALKAAIDTDPTRVLDSWSDSDFTPCHWDGVLCTRDRVTQLSLSRRGFTGYIPSELGLLDSLTLLTLAGNNFSRLIPLHLYNATNLVSLDLSHNSLSGPISDQIKHIKSLRHLDLSSNLLNGSLPEGLGELPHLVGTLNLSYNHFSGGVPASYGNLPVVVNLDLRFNNLTGKLPQVGSLLNQGPTSFYGNPSLCGFPLQTSCPEAQNPRGFSSSEEPQNPKENNAGFPGFHVDRTKEKRVGSLIVAVISGVSVIAGIVSVSVWWCRRRGRSVAGEDGKMGRKEIESEVEEGQKGSKFVIVDEGFNLELEDLLRASAYVIGKSRSGIVYKVVAGRGSGAAATVVAVRRLSEGDWTWRLKEFESEVEGIGRVQHPNIVRLRAYYYANDEKLLVSDFIRNGSLHNALRGDPSNPLPPLTWATRLKIAQGASRGLAYIHDLSPRKYVHGNIKSTKILLDDDLQSYISGFGLNRLTSGASRFTTPPSKKQNLNPTVFDSTISNPSMYLAPELLVPGGKYTQKCDVYSFGIVLMEILTGQLPETSPENDGKGLERFVRKAFSEGRSFSEIIDPTLAREVAAEKQVIATFHIALNCTETDPELRPRMRTVSESLDRIRWE